MLCSTLCHVHCVGGAEIQIKSKMRSVDCNYNSAVTLCHHHIHLHMRRRWQLTSRTQSETIVIVYTTHVYFSKATRNRGRFPTLFILLRFSLLCQSSEKVFYLRFSHYLPVQVSYSFHLRLVPSLRSAILICGKCEKRCDRQGINH